MNVSRPRSASPIVLEAPIVTSAIVSAVALLGDERFDPWSAVVAVGVVALAVAVIVHVRTLGRDLRRELDATERAGAKARAVLERANDPYVEFDQHGRVLDWNRPAAETFGWTAAEVVGRPVLEVLVPERYRAELETSWLAPDGGGGSALPPIELVAQHRDGQQIPVEVTLWHTGDDWRARHHAFVRDITERRRQQAALERQAQHDPLTGLPNRARLEDELQRRLSAHETVGVMVIDLDHFKEVNDGLGHEVGDHVLREVGTRLVASVRSSDVVARLGGDEFAVLVGDVDSISTVTAIAEGLVEMLEEPVTVDGFVFLVGASIGLAVGPHQGDDGRVLLSRADVAMYRAKRQGISFAVFGAQDDDVVSDRLQLVTEMRKAIEHSVLDVHYQPKVSLVTGAVLGVEALVRWTHPERGKLARTQFVPLAEHAGLIGPLTRLVLRQSLQQCSRWAAEGLEVPVAVNVSPSSLYDDDLVTSIELALGNAGLTGERLTIELTESVFAEETPEVRDTLAQLRALGVRVSIDDFGTGYSSLAYLKTLPVDEVKIDRSFVRTITTDERDRSIVRAILQVARSLELGVVAEGIESSQAAAQLVELGCEVGQGFALCWPTPASDLTGWLAGRSGKVTTSSSSRLRG